MTLTTSLPLSKRLKEAGVPQESMFVWSEHTDPATLWRSDLFDDNDVNKIRGYENYAAFLSDELARWLPDEIEFHENYYDLNLRKWPKEWTVYYYNDAYKKRPFTMKGETLAEAMGEILCYLLKEGLISKEDLK